MGSAILFLFHAVIQIVIWLIIINVIVSWLVAFGVLNIRNPTIYRIVAGLEALTEPLLRPIRRFMPNLGGIDLSPLILILLLQALNILIDRTLAGPLINTLG